MSRTTPLRDSGNWIIDRMSDGDYDRFRPSLQAVNFPLKGIVLRAGDEVESLYFPTTSMLSLLTVLEEDDPVEVSTVGREGFVGVSASLGVVRSPHQVLCQLGGAGLRLPIRIALDAMRTSAEFTALIHRYVSFFLETVSLTVACNAVHAVEARACRWILMTHDQAGRDDFPMTHEFLAFMLGVRRQTVTVVAGTIQSAGLIDYRRGSITVLDRHRLEEAACECFASNHRAYRRIFP